ncbi:MAG: hypothetical protein KBT34_10310 [Prevotella sp.]|nr:hypothetical protein [Candidatus Prevotella equi]
MKQKKDIVNKVFNITKEDETIIIRSKQDSSLIAEGDTLGGIIKKNFTLGIVLKHDITSVYTIQEKMHYGLSETENRWYAWSNNGTYNSSFGIGSEVRMGDDAYEPDCKETFKLRALKFWDSKIYEKVTIENETEEGFDIILRWSTDPDIVKNKSVRGGFTAHHYNFPEQYGRGEWKAETLDDAKQMAISWISGITR